MANRTLDHHPRRFELTNELHARPFMPVSSPARAVTVAFKQTENAAERDPDRDRAHLIELIDRHGGAHPAPGANHHLADFGRFQMKWERHTEFVSYLIVEQHAPGDAPFEGSLAGHFPPEWLASAPGQVISAIEVEVLSAPDAGTAEEMLSGPLGRAFNPESLVMSRIIDGKALAVGDFRIHEGGFSRFALIVHGAVGPRRVGRAVQRLFEIETYRMLSMLALPIAREVTVRLNEIDRELTQLIRRVASRETAAGSEKTILDELTALSAEIEALSASTAFRFGAAGAYEAIVHERIDMLREQRVEGRQLFSEFMGRRYSPAMRTVKAAEGRLSGLATRASRIADLLRTRVDVALEAQNQELLTSMNKRAALQLRLQQTVEGLSVVAISYYAVSLAGYILAPVALWTHMKKELLTAIIAVPVVLAVWGFVRKIRRHIEEG